MNTLKTVVGDADHLLKELTDSTADEFSAARTKIEDRLGEARSRLHGARIAVEGKAHHVAEVTNGYVRENPWKTIGAVAAIALAVGVLLRRR